MSWLMESNRHSEDALLGQEERTEDAAFFSPFFGKKTTKGGALAYVRADNKRRAGNIGHGWATCASK